MGPATSPRNRTVINTFAPMRLDNFLVAHGFFPSRTQAQRAIREGQISLDGQPCTKPAQDVSACNALRVAPQATMRFVGLGGYKLLRAAQHFHLNFTGCTALDIGASTGGFTDCLLQHGANKVYAVDVGHGQLAPTLLADPRVVSLEGLHIANLTTAHLNHDHIDWVVCDVSFIPLERVLPHVAQCLAPQGQALLLVKPQFEVGPGHVDRHGLVLKPALHLKVLERLLACCRQLALMPLGLTHSPIRGPEHNIEYLLYLKKDGPTVGIDQARIVTQAFASLHDNGSEPLDRQTP